MRRRISTKLKEKVLSGEVGIGEAPRRKRFSKSDADYKPVKYKVSILNREDLRPLLVSVWNSLRSGEISATQAKAFTSIANCLLKLFADAEEARAREDRKRLLDRMLKIAEQQGIRLDLNESLLLEGPEEDSDYSVQ